tara:strand:+ start:32399 stop:32980 length:582 start_codon:yes stop_codon:yes gene_type:complete
MINNIYITIYLIEGIIILKKNKKSLNEILESYQSIEMMLVDNEGVINEDIEKLLDINETDLKSKLDSYQGFSKYLEGQISYLKVMESHYAKRRKVLENSIRRCKESMVNALSVIDTGKIKTSNYNFSLGESESWTVDVDDIDDSLKENLIEKGLAENVFKISMNELKKEYKSIEKEKRPRWIKVSSKKYVRSS